MLTVLKIFLPVFFISLMFSCSPAVNQIEHGDIMIEFDQNLNTRVSNKSALTPLMQDFENSEYLSLSNRKTLHFKKTSFEKETFNLNGKKGTVYLVTGKNAEDIHKNIRIRLFDDFPGMLTYQVTYKNQGEKILDIKNWTNHNYSITSSNDTPAFWSFQGSSTSARADWIRPVSGYHSNNNYMGMNNSDYGGGIPVLDLWRKDAGIAVGHVELVPKLVSTPIHKERNESKAEIAVRKEFKQVLAFNPGDQITTLETFVSVHEGDCFNTLRQFSEFMQAKGIEFPDSEPSAFEAMWCAWGYERNFTIDEVLGTLPKVKEMGIKWATLDDGFQITEGDWTTNKDKFPNGDQDMLRLTKAIHDHGLKAQIWWAPLAVSPDSKLLEQEPNILLKTEEWAPQYITWWDAWYMAPTDPVVLQHTADVVTMFIDKWDFDGIKLDGQHLNAVKPDHGEDHGINNPEEAVEKLPDFFHHIYETARSIKPNALLQHCPCGTCMSFYNMPTTNQVVSSDPLNSAQIRQKGKVYKAIMPQTAYFGDHVELSDNGDDFATSFGIGAVLGTKFTWPKDNPSVTTSYLLTPEKEEKWKLWFDLYNEKMLSKEQYLGKLYDIGYDIPETHVIQKSDTLFFSFYADEWTGKIHFKGLDETKKYKVYDYVNERDLGQILGSDPMKEMEFKQNLLVEVYPE